MLLKTNLNIKQKIIFSTLLNRPGVARAVLQTSSLITKLEGGGALVNYAVVFMVLDLSGLIK